MLNSRPWENDQYSLDEAYNISNSIYIEIKKKKIHNNIIIYYYQKHY